MPLVRRQYTRAQRQRHVHAESRGQKRARQRAGKLTRTWNGTLSAGVVRDEDSKPLSILGHVAQHCSLEVVEQSFGDYSNINACVV